MVLKKYCLAVDASVTRCSHKNRVTSLFSRSYPCLIGIFSQLTNVALPLDDNATACVFRLELYSNKSHRTNEYTSKLYS